MFPVSGLQSQLDAAASAAAALLARTVLQLLSSTRRSCGGHAKAAGRQSSAAAVRGRGGGDALAAGGSPAAGSGGAAAGPDAAEALVNESAVAGLAMYLRSRFSGCNERPPPLAAYSAANALLAVSGHLEAGFEDPKAAATQLPQGALDAAAEAAVAADAVVAWAVRTAKAAQHVAAAAAASGPLSTEQMLAVAEAAAGAQLLHARLAAAACEALGSLCSAGGDERAAFSSTQAGGGGGGDVGGCDGSAVVAAVRLLADSCAMTMFDAATVAAAQAALVALAQIARHDGSARRRLAAGGAADWALLAPQLRQQLHSDAEAWAQLGPLVANVAVAAGHGSVASWGAGETAVDGAAANRAGAAQQVPGWQAGASGGSHEHADAAASPAQAELSAEAAAETAMQRLLEEVRGASFA